MYSPDEFDKNQWTFYGEPETTVIVNKPATVELTCADILNRIPQLIDAEPGYISTDRMPYSSDMVRPKNEYVTSLRYVVDTKWKRDRASISMRGPFSISV